MLTIVGIVVALCCCGAVVGGFALFKSVKAAVGPAQDTVDAFLGHLENGETAIAYTYLCSPAREEFTPDQFDGIVGARPRMTGHDIVGTNVSNNNGVVSATVNAELTYGDGSSETHTFRLAKEGGDWRVCGDPY